MCILKRLFYRLPETELKKRLRAFIHRILYKEYKTYYKEKIWELHYDGFILRYFDVPSSAATNYLFLKKFVDREYDIIVDAGGFIGTFGLLMAKRYPRSKVIIFEPDPTNFEKIRMNIRLNNFQNVTLERYGLWSESARRLQISSNGLSSSIYGATDKVIQIETMSLDDYFKTYFDNFVFVKMNIEGAEVEAVRGSLQFLSRNKVDMAISTDHMINGALTTTAVEGLLRHGGLQAESIAEGIYVNTFATNNKS